MTPPQQKRKLKKMIQSSEVREKVNEKIIKIVYDFNYLPESMIESLQEMDTQTLNELLKEAREHSLLQKE